MPDGSGIHIEADNDDGTGIADFIIPFDEARQFRNDVQLAVAEALRIRYRDAP